jgi:serine/threonine protein kinase
MDLTPDNWKRAKALFDALLERPLSERVSYLERICPEEELRQQVAQLLLNHDQAGSFLSEPIIEHHNKPNDGRSERFASGTIVAGFKIVDLLGKGGMGLVYRAGDIKLGRRVALKFLPEESAKDPAALARFEREARAASALEHPNICPIYEFGEHEGQPFLVMQFLEGQTLRELLESKRLPTQELKPGSDQAKACGPPALPLEQVLNIAIQIAGGLEAAHKQGIIHRDIKPANIFVTNDGQAKILDFGLAKLARGATDEPAYTHDSSFEGTTRATAPLATPDPFLTRTGVAMGTAGYMSPEQARAEKLDARTDIFSFGLVLYEMTTGHRAFEGDTGPALYNAILTQTPTPARQLNPKLPARLVNIVNKALEKNRDARYQSVSEMRAELETLKRDTLPENFSRRWMSASAAVIVLSIIGSIFWFVNRKPQSSQTLPNVRLRQLTINSSENRVTGGAISPDGKYLAYADNKGMHIKIIETGDTQIVPQPEALTFTGVNWDIPQNAWFPDSTRFLANAHPLGEPVEAWSSQTTSIWAVSRLGGAPHKLRDKSVAWSVSPDSSLISFQPGDREIWLMGPGGEQAHKLYDAGSKNAMCCLRFFHNEKRVSYILTDDSGDTAVARDFQGGPPTTLFQPSEIKKMGDGVWLPDGRFVYSVNEPESVGEACNYWTVRLNTRSGEIIEKPKQLTNWAGFCMAGPSVSADGKRLAFLEKSSHATTYVADLEAGGKRIRNPRHFTLEEANDFPLDWTADSKTLILVYARGDHYGFYKQSLTGDTPEPIVASALGALQAASLSPDRQWIIIMLYEGQSSQIMRVPIRGGSPEPIFRVRYGTEFSCAKFKFCAIANRSEDGKQMIITAFDPIKGRGSELARFDIENFNLNRHNLLWNISPDGTRLAAARGEDAPIQIRFLRDQATQAIRAKDLNHIRGFVWAPDGGLFVSNLTKDGAEVVHLDLKGNTHLLWGPIGGGGAPSGAGAGLISAIPSPDGLHLALDGTMLSANMWMMENF